MATVQLHIFINLSDKRGYGMFASFFAISAVFPRDCFMSDNVFSAQTVKEKQAEFFLNITDTYNYLKDGQIDLNFQVLSSSLRQILNSCAGRWRAAEVFLKRVVVLYKDSV